MRKILFPKTVILEGPDGAGKSTLMEQLSELSAFKCDLVHHGPYQGVGTNELAARFAAPILNRTNPGLIMDRCWMSEPIYAEAYGRENRITMAEKRMLERIVLSYQAIMILCLPSYQTCRATFNSRLDEEYLKTDDQHKQVYQKYVQSQRLRLNNGTKIFASCIPTLIYDYTAPGAFDNLAFHLFRMTNIIHENKGPGIGCWEPKSSILVVGEQSNDKHSLPFVDIFEPKNGCSRFLAEALEEAGVEESQLYFINALNKTGNPISSRFVSELLPSKIIALGGQAAYWCFHHDLPHIKVSHPQHHKRFKSKEKYELIEVLRDAAAYAG